jgi:two-component system nitrogen regulation sensor histidine kinase NtrY
VELIDAEPDANGRVGACFTFTLPAGGKDAGVDDTVAGADGETKQANAEEPPVVAVAEK